MEFRLWHRRIETCEEMRARIIAETEAFLSECLRHPEFAVRIPMVPASSERFPPSFAAAFWEPVLAE